MPQVARPRRPKGVLAGPGTPRDPKSHLFVTKWVAVAPWDFKTGIRLRIPAQISPWGSRGPNPNFFLAHFGPKNAQKYIFWEGFEFIRDP